MIRGVIFDVDGVLLNSMPVWENLGEIYLERLGIEAEKGLGETLFAMSLEEGADYLIENYGLKQTPGEIIAGLNREVQDFYGRKVPLKEGVRGYLQEFRDRKIPILQPDQDFRVRQGAQDQADVPGKSKDRAGYGVGNGHPFYGYRYYDVL